MSTYVLRGGKLVDKKTGKPMKLSTKAIVSAPLVMPDTPGYWSVASDTWIDGRAARREDLKRTNCVEAGDMPRLNNGMAKNRDFARRHGLRWEGDH